MPSPPSPQTPAERMAQRYGRRPAAPWWRRPLPLAAAVAAGLLFVAYLVWVALASTAERAEPTLISYRVLDDTRIEARYTLAKEGSTAVRCTLQALDAGKGEVGVLEEEFGPTGETLLESRPVVRTTGRAVTVVVRSCTVLDG